MARRKLGEQPMAGVWLARYQMACHRLAGWSFVRGTVAECTMARNQMVKPAMAWICMGREKLACHWLEGRAMAKRASDINRLARWGTGWALGS